MLIDITALNASKKFGDYIFYKINQIKYIILIKLGTNILSFENNKNQNYLEIALTFNQTDINSFYYLISTYKLNSPLYYSQIIKTKEIDKTIIKSIIIKAIFLFLKNNKQSIDKIYIHFNNIDYELIEHCLKNRNWFDLIFPSLKEVKIILINYQENGKINGNMKRNNITVEKKDEFYFGSFYIMNQISICFKSKEEIKDDYLIISSNKSMYLSGINYPFPFLNVLKFRKFMENIGFYENNRIFSFFPFYLMDD